jgi:hypothetical protein
MKVIQELVAHFERQKKLSEPEIKALLDQGLLAADAPVRIQDLCDTPGTTYYFRVTGATDGSIWGTDVYTGVVRVTVMTPLAQYQGSIRNGVSSHDFGRFGAAYRVDRL